MSDAPDQHAKQEQPASRLSKLTAFVRGVASIVGGKELLAAAAALILLAVAGLGGFKQAAAEANEVASAKAGEAVTVAPFTITVTKAVHLTELPGVLRPITGVRYLGVAVTVTNTGNRFAPAGIAGPLSQALRIDAPDLLRFGAPTPSERAVATFYRVVDSLPAADLQPGLSYQLFAVWEQDASAPAPTTLSVTLTPSAYRVSALDGSMGWFASDAVARVTLPVIKGRS